MASLTAGSTPLRVCLERSAFASSYARKYDVRLPPVAVQPPPPWRDSAQPMICALRERENRKIVKLPYRVSPSPGYLSIIHVSNRRISQHSISHPRHPLRPPLQQLEQLRLVQAAAAARAAVVTDHEGEQELEGRRREEEVGIVRSV